MVITPPIRADTPASIIPDRGRSPLRQIVAPLHAVQPAGAGCGHLSTDDGEHSVRELVGAIGSQICDVEWDVRGMSGYDSGARKAWQRELLPRRRKIRSITLIGGSALVRMGASALCLMLGIECRFVAAPPESRTT